MIKVLILKYFDKEVYSRRINHKDRLVYTIYEGGKNIDCRASLAVTVFRSQ